MHLLVSLSSLGTTQYRHSHSEIELGHYIELYDGEHLKTKFFDKENSVWS